MTLSVVMVTYNSADVVEGAMRSIVGLGDELLIGDGGSRDGTVEIVGKYGGKVIQTNPTNTQIRPMNETMVLNDKNGGMRRKNLGERKQELVERAKGEWILVLDADERVSEELKAEILSVSRRHSGGRRPIESRGDPIASLQDDRSIAAYRIPYQNYVFGSPVYYGGEKYAKVRLFRRGTARISPEPLHEEIIFNGQTHKATPSKKLRGGLEERKIGDLKGVIHHQSYRTPWQLFSKFTRYAWIAARMEIASPRQLAGSRNDMLRKLFFHGPHMFWARFIKEQGYKDGWRGLILAVAFGYMEGLTYWFGLARKLHKVTPCPSASSG